jgi:hypothetical protein
MARIYLIVAVLGTVIVWWFFGSYFVAHGPDVAGFIGSLFVTAPGTGFSLDLLMSIGLFWVWSLIDARRNGVAHWWVVLPTASFVGLILAMPLYFYLRERANARPR